MTIILFLVDTSTSMVQRNHMGCAAIDTAKSIVADIMKLRQRDSYNRQTDRYMLFSTEEFPQCVKAGWKEGSGVFNEQLKALRPGGSDPLKPALLNALYFLNLNRAQTGVDYYGHGRFPHLQESVILVTITDGSGVEELEENFELRADPSRPFPGSEYTEEAFRWDQRVFSIVLRMGARCPAEPRIGTPLPVFEEAGVIQRVCSATGGRTFTVVSHKQQTSVVETLAQMIHVNGIVIRFEFPTAPGPVPRNGAAADNGEASEERQAEVAAEKLRMGLEEDPLTLVLTRNRAPGHWPIPEAFWPEFVQNNPKMPQRKAHPTLTIGPNPSEMQVNTEFPFDKYELDPECPLAEYVRDRSADLGNGNLCWQVFVAGSHRVAGVGKPFGFLKTATNGTSVNLFLMPYNYPMIMRLLEDQKVDARLRAHPEWRAKLEQYIIACPSYYRQPLKKALLRLKLGGGGVLDEPPANLYAPALNRALTNMKSAGKQEMEKLLAEIGARLSKPPQLPSYCVPVEKPESMQPPKNFRIEWEEEKRAKLAAAKTGDEAAAEQPQQKRPRVRRSRLPFPPSGAAAAMPTRTVNNTVVIEDDICSDPEAEEPPDPAPEHFPHMMMDLYAQPETGHMYRNPFSIGRDQLVQMMVRHRVNLEQQLRDSPIPALEGGLPGTNCKLQTAYELHSQPACTMGNYDEYVKSLAAAGGGPLREVEHRAVRENTFGNPFKKDKRSLAVDEVGEAPAAARENATAGMSNKDRRAMESNRPPRRKPGPLPQNAMATWRERRRSLSTVSDMSHTSEDLSDDVTQAETSSSYASITDKDEAAADLAVLVSELRVPADPAPSAAAAAPAAEVAAAATQAAAAGPTVADMPSADVEAVWGLEDGAPEYEEDSSNELMIVEEDEDEDEEPPAAKRVKLEVSSSTSSVMILSSASSSSTSTVSQASRRPWKGGSEELTLARARELKGEVCRVVRMFLSDDAMLSKLDALFSPLALRGLLHMTRFALQEVARFKKRALTATLQKRVNKLEALAVSVV